MPKAERANTIKELEEKERKNIGMEIDDLQRSLADAKSRLAKVGKPLPKKAF